MPIRPAEPNLFPDDLLDRPESTQASWWAMYTLSRQEKALMRRLHELQIAYYCPIVSNRYRSPAGRYRQSHLPLFTNYVFLSGTEEDRYRAVSTGCVSRHLPIPDPATFVAQVRAIQQMIHCGRPMNIESKLPPGTPIRIRSGPMLGVEGVIIERRGGHRLLLAVDFLQQGASVSLEDWDVERL